MGESCTGGVCFDGTMKRDSDLYEKSANRTLRASGNQQKARKAPRKVGHDGGAQALAVGGIGCLPLRDSAVVSEPDDEANDVVFFLVEMLGGVVNQPHEIRDAALPVSRSVARQQLAVDRILPGSRPRVPPTVGVARWWWFRAPDAERPSDLLEALGWRPKVSVALGFENVRAVARIHGDHARHEVVQHRPR